MKNKIIAVICATFILASFAGCRSDNNETNEENTQTTTEIITPDVEEKLVLNYPENMQELGFTTPVEFEKEPTRVVSLTSSPVLALHRMNVEMIAIPTSSVVVWPEDLDSKTTKLNSTMNTEFDIESVISLDPDFVIMGKSSKDTYGKIIEDAGITIYYVDDGHSVSYESTKMLTQELINAFGKENDEGSAIMNSFETLEARISDFRENNIGKTVMVLQSSPSSHYIQTSGGSLGSILDLLGYTNVLTDSPSSMVLLDLEKALTYDPDMLFAVGVANSSEEYKSIMEDSYESNRDYWYSIRAINENNAIYLPTSFISSAGINIVDNINNLIDMIEEHNAVEK